MLDPIVAGLRGSRPTKRGDSARGIWTGAVVLLAACSTPAASGPDAAKGTDTPAADRVVAPDVAAEGGLSDLAPEAAPADQPDAAMREDTAVLVDLPTPQDVASDTAPAPDVSERDVPEDRAAPMCSATRFEATPARHALPGGYTGSGFAGVGALSSCSGGAGRPGYALYDMNADQRPDLVVTQACGDSAVGSDHWRIHLNACM